MNQQKIWIFVTVAIIVISGAFFIRNSSDDNTSQPQPAVALQASDKPLPTNYIEYTDTVIADTPGTKVLFFHADWCPTCVELEEDIRENGVPEDITFIKVDYDKETALKQKYGIKFQTYTVLVDDDGSEVRSHFAGLGPTIAETLTGLKL